MSAMLGVIATDFGENFGKIIFKNTLVEFKKKIRINFGKVVKNFEKFGQRLRENILEILKKLWRYFSNILDKISDNLIKFCA